MELIVFNEWTLFIGVSAIRLMMACSLVYRGLGGRRNLVWTSHISVVFTHNGLMAKMPNSKNTAYLDSLQKVGRHQVMSPSNNHKTMLHVQVPGPTGQVLKAACILHWLGYARLHNTMVTNQPQLVSKYKCKLDSLVFLQRNGQFHL